jgi:hypothetical protein
MIFYIKNIHLWFRNDSEKRTLTFLPDKVNVITGAKSTGKSSILAIIDYCLLSSGSRLVEKVINENVAWYGLSLVINDKEFFIARKHPSENIGSKEVYFSSVGEIPTILLANIDIKKAKSAFELEFGIDEKMVIPYGGRKIAAGSKISYRYFLLFNTQSEDTIASTTTYFDYDLHDREKYVEALQRIFFLAIGVDEPENILIKEKIIALESEIDKIDKKKKTLQKDTRLFNDEIFRLMIKAQEYDLLEKKPFTHDEAYDELKKVIHDFRPSAYSSTLQQVEDLNRSKKSIYRKIRNLERFDTEYQQYRENLINEHDSVKPIVYLKKNFEQLIPTLEVRLFMDSLEESLQVLKKSISNKRSLTINVKSQVDDLKKQLALIDRQLSNLPTSNKAFADEVQKYVFIGEIKSQLNFFENKWNILEEIQDTEVLMEQITELNKQLKNTEAKRRVAIEILTDIIQEYFDQSNSMGVYSKYKVHFDDINKIIKIREPNELLPRSDIGSKSNYMFLHLFLFLGLHDHIIRQGGRYVPQFLLLDQPSQPYLDKTVINNNGEIEVDDDRATIKDAFKLLDNFIGSMIRQGKTFQIILLEHASKSYWENPLLTNFHLVDEFRNGNALIPASAQVKLPATQNDPESKLNTKDPGGDPAKQQDLFGPTE